MPSSTLIIGIGPSRKGQLVNEAILDGMWSPVTDEFGLIKASPESVADALVRWHDSLSFHYRRKIVPSVEEALRGLAPLSFGLWRKAFVATRSAWTAFFQSGAIGSDAFPVMSYLAGVMDTLAMRVVSGRDATMWDVYAPRSLGGDPLRYRRSLCAALDGDRWAFNNRGDVYAFETVARYRRRRIRDRFTPSMLREYLLHYDALDVFSPDFFVATSAQPAILLERVGVEAAGEGLSYDAARALR